MSSISNLYFFAYWIHDLNPVAIPLPDWFPTPGIHWYGIAYFLGFLIGAWLLHFYHTRRKISLNGDQQTSLLMHLILGLVIGGRLGYMVLYDFSNWIAQPASIFYTWEGGMASHGAIVGLVTAGWLFAKKHKISPLRLGDIIVTLAPAGVCLGRIGNFINGELWGRITDVSWAVIFPKSMPHLTGSAMAFIPPRHPSQLYEAFLEGIVLLIYTQLRFWRKKPLPSGQLFGEFFIGYSFLRILGEIFREPDASLILNLSRGQFYSVLLLIAGVVIIWISAKTDNTTKPPRP